MGRPRKDGTPAVPNGQGEQRKKKLERAAAKAAANKPKMGRPSKFKAEFVEQANKLCILGATDQEVADFFHVSVFTILRWKFDRPDFCQAMAVGKEYADNRVERSLYQRANGYNQPVEKVFCHEGEIVTYRTTQHIPAETKACEFWLKNRRGVSWREKQEIQHVAPDLSQTAAEIRAEMIADLVDLGMLPASVGHYLEAQGLGVTVTELPGSDSSDGTDGTAH